MTYNSLLDQCIAISGWIRQGKAYYKKGRMQDGKHSLDKALVIIDPIITELQKRPEIQEQDVWRDL